MKKDIDPQHTVSEICDRFESDWLRGMRPKIEDHIAAIADAQTRPQVFSQLLEIEFRHRLGTSRPLSLDECRERFPDEVPDLAAVFSALSGQGTTVVGQADETLQNAPGVRDAGLRLTPEFKTRHADYLSTYLRRLDQHDPSGSLRQIAEWKLDGWSNHKIAKQLNRVERAIQRKVVYIETLWLCPQFEIAWESGDRPRIEDSLTAVGPLEQPKLFERLLALEARFRHDAGEHPTTEEYQARFPQYRDMVAHVIDALVPVAPADQQWYELLCELSPVDDDLTDDDSDGAFPQVDEFLMAHYLSGDCTDEQRQLVEQAMQADAGLRASIESIQGHDDSQPTDADRKWEQAAAELRACRDEQRQAWGGIDHITIARYLAGECSDDERQLVEQAERQHTDLRERLNVLRSVGVPDDRQEQPLDHPADTVIRDASTAAVQSADSQDNVASKPASEPESQHFRSGAPWWLVAVCAASLIACTAMFIENRRAADLVRKRDGRPDDGQAEKLDQLGKDLRAIEQLLVDDRAARGVEPDVDQPAKSPTPDAGQPDATLVAAPGPQPPQKTPGLSPDVDTEQAQAQTTFNDNLKQIQQKQPTIPPPQFATTSQTTPPPEGEPADRRPSLPPDARVVRLKPVLAAEDPLLRAIASAGTRGDVRLVYLPVILTSHQSQKMLDWNGGVASKSVPVETRQYKTTVFPFANDLAKAIEKHGPLPDEELVRWAGVDALGSSGVTKPNERAAVVRSLAIVDPSGAAAARFAKIIRATPLDSSPPKHTLQTIQEAYSGGDVLTRWSGVYVLLADTRARPTVASNWLAENPVSDRKIPLVVEFLTDVVETQTSPLIRKTAIYALMLYGSHAKAAVGVLDKMLRDPDPEVQRWSIYALGEIGPESRRSLPALVDVLTHAPIATSPRDPRRLAAAHALGRICQTKENAKIAVTQLQNVLSKATAAEKATAGEQHTWAIIGLLRIVLEADMKSVSANKSVPVTEDLKPVPDNKPVADNNSVPVTAVFKPVKLNPVVAEVRRVRNHLIEALDDEQASVRRAAVMLLGVLYNDAKQADEARPVVEALNRILANPGDGRTAAEASDAILKIFGDSAEPKPG